MGNEILEINLGELPADKGKKNLRNDFRQNNGRQ